MSQRSTTAEVRDSPHPALGLDFGAARIGVAATDPCGILAHPVATIEVRRGDPVAAIATLAVARGARTLVIGLPRHGDGSEGAAAATVRAFAARLATQLPNLPVVFIDESYSTLTATAKLRAAGRDARRAKPALDQAAAVEILDRWLATLGTPAAAGEPPPPPPAVEPARKGGPRSRRRGGRG